MKKQIILFFTFFVILIIGISFWWIQKNDNTESTVTYTLEGKKLKLLLADTNAQRAKGLMYYRKLENADGMLFTFPSAQYQTFWNKNTYMDLDVYWINGSNVVGKSFLPSIEKSKKIVTITSPEKADKVIEIPR